MSRLLGLFAVLTVLVGAASAADKYTIDPTYTIATFEIAHLGITTQQGRFNRASGTVMLDMANRKGNVDLSIDTTSIDMSSVAWTKHMAEPELFNASKYPTMTFKSNTLLFQDGKVVGADGEFTMRGITKPLHVDVVGFRCMRNPRNNQQVCGGDVTAIVKRSEFGMTKYIPEVSDEIRIRVPVEAYKD
jgi:polyisoprenoid-binding protein YceI